MRDVFGNPGAGAGSRGRIHQRAESKPRHGRLHRPQGWNYDSPRVFNEKAHRLPGIPGDSFAWPPYESGSSTNAVAQPRWLSG